jgi:hypothetical protein
MRPWFKKKRFVIPIAIVALSAISSLLPSEDSNTANPAPSQSSPGGNESTAPEQNDGPGIGDEAADGNFTFVVNSIECGISKVGGEFLNTEAKGEFCKVSLTVTNTGDEANYMFADNQYLIDSEGREFTSDSTANLYSQDDGDVWMTELNPGLSVKGDMYFDVPVGAKMTQIELHDSMFSGGVLVNLS